MNEIPGKNRAEPHRRLLRHTYQEGPGFLLLATRGGRPPGPSPRTRFGSWILRGKSRATFEPDGDGTRVTQEFETVGWMSAISSWVFSRGSYEGSFRGELEKFGRIAEREARE